VAAAVLAAAGWAFLGAAPAAPSAERRMMNPAPAAAAAPAAQGQGPCMARYTGPGRAPPERWDDIFWENDRTAHRIYGPAVSRPAPNGEGLVTSGIDVWVKKVRTPFMDKQLATGAQHDDTTGMGRDCYDVQQTCGAGGLGIWDESAKKLMRSANWADKGGFVTGGDVASFWVSYAPWDAGGGRKVQEKRTFTLPAGTNFTRLVSQIDDASTPANSGELLVGIGIAKRKSDGTRFKGEDKLVTDKDKGLMVYWEPDQTYRTPAAAGHTGVAVVVDPKSIVKFVEDKNAAGDVIQNLVIVRVTPGKPWVYYTGACWSLGLDFHTAEEWETYARNFKPNFDPEGKYSAQ
jgi:hypothetical protein